MYHTCEFSGAIAITTLPGGRESWSCLIGFYHIRGGYQIVFCFRWLLSPFLRIDRCSLAVLTPVKPDHESKTSQIFFAIIPSICKITLTKYIVSVTPPLIGLTHWDRKIGRRFAGDFTQQFSCVTIVCFYLNINEICYFNNMPALVLMMAWCRLGDKPSSEPSLLEHIYIRI